MCFCACFVRRCCFYEDDVAYSVWACVSALITSLWGSRVGVVELDSSSVQWGWGGVARGIIIHCGEAVRMLLEPLRQLWIRETKHGDVNPA